MDRTMGILETGEQKHTVNLPPTCVDPKEYKVGDSIEYKIKGKVKAVDEKFGTTVELSEGDEDEDMEEFESLDDEGQKKKIKKQFDSKNQLEEY